MGSALYYLGCRPALVSSIFPKKQASQFTPAVPALGEVEAEGSGIEGHPRLHSKFEASLGYMRPGLQRTKKKPGLGSVLEMEAERSTSSRPARTTLQDHILKIFFPLKKNGS